MLPPGSAVSVASGSDVERLLVVATAGTWLVVGGLILVSHQGRAYLSSDAGTSLTEENLATRLDSLTIAGLVFAGLAIIPMQRIESSAPVLLTASLVAFLSAWGAGFYPARTSSTFIRDGMHWIGLAALLGAVFHIAAGLTPSSLLPTTSATAGTAVIFAYSLGHARAHHRSAGVINLIKHVRKPHRSRGGRPLKDPEYPDVLHESGPPDDAISHFATPVHHPAHGVAGAPTFKARAPV
jgi:hypothetical protein